MRRIHELYEKGLNPGSEGSVGLLSIAHDPLLNVTCWKPRKKVNVMIIGNHSAGKSSFINWYIGESVQTTGVAIETRGFTYVTSGRKRETLKGDATFAFYDHIDGLQKFKGITDNVFTEISTSKARAGRTRETRPRESVPRPPALRINLSRNEPKRVF